MTVSLQTLQALFIGSFISGDLVDGVDICIPFNVLHIFWNIFDAGSIHRKPAYIHNINLHTHSYTLLNQLAHYFNRLPTKYSIDSLPNRLRSLIRIILQNYVVLKLWPVNYRITCIGIWGWNIWILNDFSLETIYKLLFYVWVSVHHNLIYIKNQRDATWQYVY